MHDLLEAAGGTTANADDLAYFENAQLKAGTTYYIASKFDETDICSKSEISKVNINEDDAQTLMTVTGITTAIASSIVSYRNEDGNFNTIEDLLAVYGIGNATYHKVRNYVILHS
jgi:competence protein ComEA